MFTAAELKRWINFLGDLSTFAPPRKSCFDFSEMCALTQPLSSSRDRLLWQWNFFLRDKLGLSAIFLFSHEFPLWLMIPSPLSQALLLASQHLRPAGLKLLLHYRWGCVLPQNKKLGPALLFRKESLACWEMNCGVLGGGFYTWKAVTFH